MKVRRVLAQYSPGVLLGAREHLAHLVRGRVRVRVRVRGKGRIRGRRRDRGTGRGTGRVRVSRVRRIWRTSCSTASREVVDRLLSSWLG